MTRSGSNETEIRNLITDLSEALHDKDAKRVLSHYAPGSVVFDLAPPLQHAGAGESSEKGLDDWFATWQGPIGHETRDVSITTDGQIAYCHGFIHISGTKVGGERNEVWARQTTCLKKIDGAWKITHDHTSVPFYMDGSLKAAVDLKP
ncbi:MAG TPA: nuclear transport factor 2 family protein [Dongiaceae bacterium]|nr:nuclear transport factor 2 family protein [Dongiaceae bacterium]